MQKKLITLLLILLVSGISVFSYRFVIAKQREAAEQSHVLGLQTQAKFVHREFDFNWDLYRGGLQKVSENPPQSLGKKIYGGIVPHHLLQSHYIADLYARLQTQNSVKTVIIIGPNHPESGTHWALTSSGSWETPDGLVEADTEKIKTLQKAGVLREDTANLHVEHSINSQVPFIAHYLPGAKVVPIVLSAYTTQQKITQLVEALVPLLSEDTVVVASVDFSHYLNKATAEEMDVETKTLLENRRYSELLEYAENADHTDSPASLVSLMQAMDAIGAGQLHFLANTNSGEILKNDSIPTTSYFEIAFTQ